MENQRLAYDNARTAYDVALAAVRWPRQPRIHMVRAPFSGVVTVKVAQVGEVVAPSAPAAATPAPASSPSST